MTAPKVILPTEKISEMDKPDSYCTVVAEILNIPRFENETDVREDFVAPLLKALGYSNSGKSRIERNIYLEIPDLVMGRKKKSMEQYSPDYVLSVGGVRKWLVDAKGPNESVRNQLNISQAYSYSIHREINVQYFVLCNGEEFAVYRTRDSGYSPTTVFKRYELDYRWQELYEMFSVDAFKTRLTVIAGDEFKEKPIPKESKKDRWDHPINRVIEPKKQGSPIHHGTHPYFTKRAWNVVRDYIAHFSEPGETVLDPYGGAGVTAIEAFLTGRNGIHADINPIANFMTEALAVPVELADLSISYEKIMKVFEPKVDEIYELKNPKPEYWFPKNVTMPRDSDVEKLDQLFTPKQLACMSVLKHEIEKIKNGDLKRVFLLMFSSTLVKCNISFHNTPRKHGIPGGGDAGFLKYYRYQIPKHLYKEQNPIEVFESKYRAMFKAKQEVRKYGVDLKAFHERLRVLTESATELTSIADESVDYVFTDPPYGNKIAYLDCSTIWNAWLNLPVTEKNYKDEVISGGKLKKSDEEYIRLLQRSLNQVYRVLKADRWFSIVFASENPRFWHAIRDYCIKIGFSHENTVCQPSQRKTVKKNQNPLTVFKGELILNFRKRRGNKHIVGVSSKLPPKQYVLNSAELTIVVNEGKATIEQIMQDLIPKLWESGLLGAVSNEIEDINEILKEAFDYDKKEGVWIVRAKTKIGCHIPLESRMKFYLLSCLNKARSEKRKITIDDIIMEVMPFLRNGITPSNQDIIDELKKLASSKDGQHWELKISGEFDF